MMSRRPPLSPGLALRPQLSAVRPEWSRSDPFEGLVERAEVSIRHCVALDPNGMRVVTQEDTGALAVTSRTAGTERLGAVAVRTAVPAQDPKFSAVRPEWLRSSCIEGLVGHAQASLRHCVALDPNGVRAITRGVLA